MKAQGRREVEIDNIETLTIIEADRIVFVVTENASFEPC
jgi:hypothetical protein